MCDILGGWIPRKYMIISSHRTLQYSLEHILCYGSKHARVAFQVFSRTGLECDMSIWVEMHGLFVEMIRKS